MKSPIAGTPALILFSLAFHAVPARAQRPVVSARAAQAAPRGIVHIDRYTLYGPRNYISGYPLANSDGTYNMVVEMPTGTNEKWETCTTASLRDVASFPGCTKPGREIVLEVRKGKRRIVQYMGTPGNYGALAQTRGGDGDPLDVLAIGPAAMRGMVIAVRVVGVLRCTDGGERDDKLVAVTRGSPLYSRVRTAASLETVAPKAAEIARLWFENYKGAGGMQCAPLSSEVEAAGIIAETHTAYETAR